MGSPSEIRSPSGKGATGDALITYYILGSSVPLKMVLEFEVRTTHTNSINGNNIILHIVPLYG